MRAACVALIAVAAPIGSAADARAGALVHIPR
jgi:hypothetical protein